MTAEPAAPVPPVRRSRRRRVARVRDRLLGSRLRALRIELTDLKLEQVAAIVRTSITTLSRLENGRRHITTDDVEALLTAYGAPASVRLSLMDLVEQSAQEYICTAVDHDSHYGVQSLEEAAHSQTEWSITQIPLLLQTDGYASAQLLAAGTPPAAVLAHIDLLHRRRAMLSYRAYTAFIHEAAFDADVAQRAALRDQLAHLAQARQRGINIRVVRHGSPVSRVSSHSWMYLKFRKDPPIVHLRLHRVGIYLDGPEAQEYEHLCAQLDDMACDSRDSQRFLADRAKRL